MVVRPDSFMLVVVFSSGGSFWVWEVIPDPVTSLAFQLLVLLIYLVEESLGPLHLGGHYWWP